MEEESEPCAKMCGNCVHFSVLDDQPGDPCKWFGVCWLELEQIELKRYLGHGYGTVETLDWVYDHGRHGDDDCERPDEWFKED